MNIIEMDEMEKESLTNGNAVRSNSVGEMKNTSKFRNVLARIKTVIMNNLLLVLTLLGVVLGYFIGFGTRKTNPTKNALMWLGLPGELYLRLLKMMIVPLIACSVICGAAALEPKANGKISLFAFIFVISTNAIGSALGIGCVYMFNPGADNLRDKESVVEGTLQTQDIIADLIRNIIPDNLFESTFSQTQTMYNVKIVTKKNISDEIQNVTAKEVSKFLGKTNNPNIIGLIFACTLLGIAATNLKEKGKAFLDLVQSICDTVIAVIRWFMWTTPIGVVSLIAVSIASLEVVEEVFAQMGLFIAAISVGIASQQLLIMPGIFFLFTRKNPYTFLISIARPWMIAFVTTSTAVAIPEMMAACEDKNKIDKRISRFVIPFSVTISCNGAALYISAATLFVANLTGTLFTIGDVILLWMLVTVSVMAIPSIPSASFMATIMTLSSLNIPVDDVALLLAVEWYLDRIRTTSSIVSHTFCTAVVWSLCKQDLEKIDDKHKHTDTDDVIINLEGAEEEVTVFNDKILNDHWHT